VLDYVILYIHIQYIYIYNIYIYIYIYIYIVYIIHCLLNATGMSHLKVRSNEADLACIGASATVSTCVCARVIP